MYFNMAALDQKRCYKLLASTVVPRPIAWVVTSDDQGVVNAAPFSFFNFFSGFPPVVCIGIGHRDGKPKDSLVNIRSTGEFVVNLVSEDLAEAMSITAGDFPPGVNELEKAELKILSSMQIDLPRIALSPVSIECKLSQVIAVDTTAVIVIAHVIGMHIRDDAVIDAERCYIDTSKLKIIGRMENPDWYTRTNERFNIRPTKFDHDEK
jgi:flavin reductase (DIM6/NTAB) family NADH-FMN oxidoreductase RutF